MLGRERSGLGAVPSKCSVLMSGLEIKMKKYGLCPPRVLGLVESITCRKANLTQCNNCLGGVHVHGGFCLEAPGKTSQRRQHAG